jgi:hypothetical protein
MKEQLANIVLNEKHLLQGFKVGGVFPFYLKYIRTDTHIELCKIREQINAAAEGTAPTVADFYNPKLQEQVSPLILDYCKIALLNNRRFKTIIGWFLERKLKTCGQNHILNLYVTIQKLNEPAFFLAYWNLIRQNQSTLLKEDAQS